MLDTLIRFIPSKLYLSYNIIRLIQYKIIPFIFISFGLLVVKLSNKIVCNSGHWGSSRRVFASKNMAVWPAIYIARYIDDIMYKIV